MVISIPAVRSESSILIIVGFFISWRGIYCRGNVYEGIISQNCSLKFLSTEAETINISQVEGTYIVSIPPFSSERIDFDVDDLGNYLISIPITGKDAGIVGYFLVIFGIIICFMGNLSILNSRYVELTAFLVSFCSIIGIIILFSIRTNYSVIRSWGSISYAISKSDYTLGFPAGPKLCIIGFILASIFSIISLKIKNKKKAQSQKK